MLSSGVRRGSAPPDPWEALPHAWGMLSPQMSFSPSKALASFRKLLCSRASRAAGPVLLMGWSITCTLLLWHWAGLPWAPCPALWSWDLQSQQRRGLHPSCKATDAGHPRGGAPQIACCTFTGQTRTFCNWYLLTLGVQLIEKKCLQHHRIPAWVTTSFKTHSAAWISDLHPRAVLGDFWGPGTRGWMTRALLWGFPLCWAALRAPLGHTASKGSRGKSHVGHSNQFKFRLTSSNKMS